MMHKFSPGDRVRLVPTGWNRNVRPGTYTIVRAMPVTNQGCQYRARNDLDSHDRVLDEAEIRAADASATPHAAGTG